MKATRQAVYAAIDTEREYQKGLARHDVKFQQPMERVAIIERIISDIKDHWYDKSGQPPMDFFRKIAAVAVAAMEDHGAPVRFV